MIPLVDQGDHKQIWSERIASRQKPGSWPPFWAYFVRIRAFLALMSSEHVSGAIYFRRTLTGRYDDQVIVIVILQR